MDETSHPQSETAIELTGGPSGGQWRWYLGLVGVFVSTFLLYFPAFRGTPIWDDFNLMKPTKSVGTIDLVSSFTHPFFSYFRPLTSTSFVIENALFHGNPVFYHLTNITLHALAAVLIACFTVLLTRKRLAGILAGLFFSAQPLQVAAVAWIGGRTDALSSFFVTMLLVCLLMYYRTAKAKWLYGSAFVYLLAALSKEQAAFILPAIPLSVFVFGSKKWADVGRMFIPFGFAFLVYVGLWILGGPMPHGVSASPGYMLFVTIQTAAHYGGAFLAPHESSLFTFTLEAYKGFLAIPLGLGVLVGSGLLVRWAWSANRGLFWVGVCGLLLYWPVSNLPLVPSIVVAPYRCALPGICVACLMGIACGWAMSSRKVIPVALLVGNLLVGTVVAYNAILKWTSPTTFYRTTYRYEPHWLWGDLNYAAILDHDPSKAEEASEVTSGLLTWIFGSESWPVLIDEQKKAALTPSVINRLRETSTSRAAVGSCIATYAIEARRVRNNSDTALLIRDALVMAPGDDWIHYIYGNLVFRRDRAEAIRHWETALTINPNYPDCLISLGHARLQDLRYREAAELLKHGLAGAPDRGDAWLELANAEIGMGDYSLAKSSLARAGSARIRPDPMAVEAATKRLLLH